MTIATSTATSLADLKAAATSKISIVYDTVVWTWMAGDFSATPADQLNVNVVKSDSAALSAGAWVRESATEITFRQAGATVTRIANDKLSDTINARDFGAKFDGTTDDTAALQAAINAAHTQGKKLLLPGGTAIISGAGGLDLRGKTVDIEGVANKTALVAATAGMTMINAEEASDVIYSPFSLRGLTLSGDNKAAYGLRVRYRHHSIIEDLQVFLCTTGVYEKDTWLSERARIRVDSCTFDYVLEGSNHNSVFRRLSLSGASDTHLTINNNGSAGDGNVALVFIGCDIESGTGRGIYLAYGVRAEWISGYLGEKISGRAIYNDGASFHVSGGFALLGFSANAALVEPNGAGGITTFDGGVQIGGQTYGNASLLCALSAAKVAAGKANYGRVAFVDCQINVILGGLITFPGDVLDYVPGPARRFCEPNGINWGAVGSYTDDSANAANPNNGRTKASGTAVFGRGNTPANTNWRRGEFFTVIVVYRASKPIQLRLDGSILGAQQQLIDTLPAAADFVTYVNVLQPAVTPTGTPLWELLMQTPSVNDFMEIAEVFIMDSSFNLNINTALRRLYKPV